MVELYIDGTPVVLPQDFGTEIKIENSFFTKNGEYTYDIKLSLLNATNSKLYAHLHRLNSVDEVKTRRTAILVANNRVFIHGTEIITGWDEQAVSIQLVSGNSELNYLLNSEMLISDLDMGSVDLPDGLHNDDIPTSNINSQYPDADYVLAPVYNSVSNEIINMWTYIYNRQDGYEPEAKFGFDPRNGVIPQPYLMGFIKRLLKALGYTIGTFQLDRSDYTQLFIAHTHPTKKYAKMVPGWTVKDFLAQVENLFNVVLVINNKQKKVDVLFANQFYASAKQQHIHPVEDDYEVDQDGDNRIVMSNATVSYDLPNTDYFKSEKLSDAVRNLCDTHAETGFDNVLAYLQANKPKRTIVTDTATGRQYVYDMGSPRWIRQVDLFQDLKRDTEETIDLSLIPAGMIDVKIPYVKLDGDYSDSKFYPYAIPCPISEMSSDNEEESGFIADIIDNNNADSSSGSNKISLAFYFGVHCLSNDGNNEIYCFKPYPISCPDNELWVNKKPHIVSEERFSLRLSKLDTYLYSGVYDIDTTKPYTFYSYDPNLPDANGVFVIRNRRFVCKEMVWTISRGELQKRWKFVGYPIKLADSEAEKKWILADGRWRDHAVWLDNGRWLDDPI